MPAFLPSHLFTRRLSGGLTVYLFTFLFFNIWVFIRVRLWLPLSSFLFPISGLNVLVSGALNLHFLT